MGKILRWHTLFAIFSGTNESGILSAHVFYLDFIIFFWCQMDFLNGNGKPQTIAPSNIFTWLTQQGK